MNEQRPEVDMNLVPMVLWFAFMSSVGAFIFVAYTTAAKGEDAVPFTFDELTMVFFAAGTAAAAASLIVPKLLLRAAQGPGYEQLSKQEQAQRIFVPMIIGFTLSESVGVFGVVVAIMRNSFETAIPFFAVSLILLVLNKPKKV